MYATPTWYQGLRYGELIHSFKCSLNNVVIDAPRHV
jgi:hypothetical protein